jgi:hypothetical protein
MPTEARAATSAARCRRAAAWRKFLQVPAPGRCRASHVRGHGERRRRWLGQRRALAAGGLAGTEVGWRFKRGAWGRGYATEAAIAAIDWAFANLGWTEVIHSIDPDNKASIMLASASVRAIAAAAACPSRSNGRDRHLCAIARRWEAGRAARTQAQAEARAAEQRVSTPSAPATFARSPRRHADRVRHVGLGQLLQVRSCWSNWASRYRWVEVD